jgi:hypothetical protein
MASLGVDFIKFRTIASPETYRAIAEESKAKGLMFVGHQFGSPETMVGAGQKSIEHYIYPPIITNPSASPTRLGQLALRPRSTGALLQSLVAILNDNLSTKHTQEGGRSTLTVRAPPQYDGASIEGHVAQVNRSGRVSGRAEMSFEFDRIRLRDGRTSNFAGYLESVRTTSGETIKVDNEGRAKDDDSQTNRAVTRTGIGAAVGAVIGAIVGGGKGAAIGAAVGAGAGAGSVYVQGREDLDLMSGTEFTIRASAPR